MRLAKLARRDVRRHLRSEHLRRQPRRHAPLQQSVERLLLGGGRRRRRGGGRRGGGGGGEVEAEEARALDAEADDGVRAARRVVAVVGADRARLHRLVEEGEHLRLRARRALAQPVEDEPALAVRRAEHHRRAAVQQVDAALLQNLQRRELHGERRRRVGLLDVIEDVPHRERHEAGRRLVAEHRVRLAAARRAVRRERAVVALEHARDVLAVRGVEDVGRRRRRPEDVREAEVALSVAHAVGRVGRDGAGRAAAAVNVEFGPKAERHLHERLLLLCASGIRGVRHGGVRTLGCQRACTLRRLGAAWCLGARRCRPA